MTKPFMESKSKDEWQRQHSRNASVDSASAAVGEMSASFLIYGLINFLLLITLYSAGEKYTVIVIINHQNHP